MMTTATASRAGLSPASNHESSLGLMPTHHTATSHLTT